MRGSFVVLVALAAGGCVPVVDDVSSGGGVSAGADVPFATIMRGNYCTGASAGAFAVQSEGGIPDGWRAEWFGDADFDKQTAFAVGIGRQFTGGFAVSIRAIRPDDDGGVLVSYQTSAPQAGDLVTQALTNPCHIVVAPKIKGKAAFRRVPAGKR